MSREESSESSKSMWNDKGMTKVIKTGGGRRAPVRSEAAERQKGDWPSKDKYWGVYFYHIFAERIGQQHHSRKRPLNSTSVIESFFVVHNTD